MMVRQAHGWDVEKRWYSGPASKTKLEYELDATRRPDPPGVPYVGGVILADSRKPQRALCVSSFPFNVKPDATGQFGDTGLDAVELAGHRLHGPRARRPARWRVVRRRRAVDRPARLVLLGHSPEDGSITVATLLTLLAGNPPAAACSRTASSLSAK